jgi:hypothetical protein
VLGGVAGVRGVLAVLHAGHLPAAAMRRWLAWVGIALDDFILLVVVGLVLVAVLVGWVP